MADFSDFVPLFNETEATVRARFDADVNAGLSVDDEDYVDTRVTGFYYIVTQPSVMEFARAWDAISTRLAAAFIPYAWGEYLDYHAANRGTQRKAAVAATGVATFTGTNGTVVGTGVRLSPTQTDPNVAPPVFVTTASGTISGGTLDLPIEAEIAGVAGNIGVGSLTVFVSPTPSGVTAVSNAAETDGGTDIESDADLRTRLLDEFSGQGPGNNADYRRWALDYPGVGRVSVQPIWAGPGTVRVVVMATDGSPVASTVVDGLQLFLTGPDGQSGEAPPAAEVTVVTSVATTVNIAATITFDDGYSLDGADGTTALRDALVAQVTDYINGLDVGVDVVKNHVAAQFFRVKGVYDVAVTAPAADVTIDGTLTPPQVARIGTVTLS